MGNLCQTARNQRAGSLGARLVAATAMSFLVVLLAGCADVEPGPLVVVQAPTEPGEVWAGDNWFLPEVITVTAGSQIVFENIGRNEHNILPARGGSGWGIDEQTFLLGETYEVAFPTAGTAYFYCDIHGTEFAGMIGEIIITE